MYPDDVPPDMAHLAEVPESCPVCGALEGDCDCCLECGGDGYLSDGGCGGGCDFCRPFPRCSNCAGTGRDAERRRAPVTPEVPK